MAVYPAVTVCQEIDNLEQITKIAEELAEDETSLDLSVYLEQLQELTENPVDINSADESEISRLFYLTDFQVKALADYVNTSGKIVSVFEIASIPGFNRSTVEIMIPFIELSQKQTIKSDTSSFRSNLLSNFIIKPGETDTSDLGSPYKLLMKYRFTAGRFAGGFTTEKDNGEKLFDFLSGNISYSGNGFIKKVIIGDFSARFGQGININTGIRTGLSLTIPGYYSGRNDIRPYTSADENNFFRGAGAQFSYKKTGIILFISNNKIDGTISGNDDSTSYFIRRFYETGLHNTPSLLLKKGVITETAYGINFSYSFRNLKAGLCWSESRFSLPVQPDQGDPENLYSFTGYHSSVFSAAYSTLISRLLLFGELATNDLKHYSFVQGGTVRPSDRLTVNIFLRNYHPGFTGFHSNGPGINSSNGNEYGILGNFTFEAAKHLFLSAGCDISRFPWLKYRSSYPSLSRRTEIKLKFIPLETFSFDLSYNIRYTMSDQVRTTGIPGIEESLSRTIKGQVRYAMNENFSLLTRIDYKITNPSGSTGVLFFQDLVYSPGKFPLKIWFRYCMFNTDSWDSRLYTYENDLINSFSIPALSGKGSRSYLMAHWEIGRRAELRAKYSLTSLIRENNFDEKDELKFQFRFWF